MVYIHVFFFLISTSSALYSKNSAVVELTSENFESEVLNSENLWIVEFYAPWCGHCKSLAPEFEKAAKALKGFFKLGAVDMTQHQSVGSKYNIQGYPTLKFFGDNKKSPTDYSSGRTSKDLISFAVTKAEEITFKRLGSKPEPKKQETKKPSEPEPEEEEEDSDVVVLTESNFETLVLKSSDLWLVEFYAPWCGHCKKLAPEYTKAASDLKGSVKLGKVDATVHSQLGSKYGVQGYPTLKFFLPGGQNEEYKGGRTFESLVATSLDRLESLGTGPKLPQLLGNDVLNDYCGKSVCVIGFLPHIYDSSVAERNGYLTSLVDISRKNRGKPVKFIWAQGGDFYELEQRLGLGSMYPSVVGLSLTKSRFAVMRSSFTQTDVENFVGKLLGGTVPLTELKEYKKLKDVQPWDGEEHKQEVVNEDL